MQTRTVLTERDQAAECGDRAAGWLRDMAAHLERDGDGRLAALAALRQRNVERLVEWVRAEGSPGEAPNLAGLVELD